MSDLDEFLQSLAGAKKAKKEQQEVSKKNLGDFLSVVAEAKAHDPKHQLLKQVKQQVQSDITELFNQLGSATKPVKIAESAEQHINHLVETVKMIDEVEREIVGEFIVEEGKYLEASTLTEVVVPEVRSAAEFYTRDEIDSLLKNASFQQPNPKTVDPNIGSIQQKLKFLEQAIGKIVATGPGSGEVNFRWLDDVNRHTMTDSNDNWVLEYDAATKKVQFTETVGPIRTVAFNLDGPLVPLVPGQIAYNLQEDCLDVRHADDTTLQVGLEQHMIVRNESGSTLANGAVVRFAGVLENGDVYPLVVPHIANGTIPPLYTVGILTNTLTNHSVGRATTFGKVRHINTTGSDVGEVWANGDILYVSPSTAGKLTKVKPTAPNIVVVVAAVLKAHATEGILLVRPTIFPRLYYGSFSDTTNQLAALPNTPYVVKYNTTDIANGHRIVNTSRVVAENSGLYNYQFSLQLTSTNSAAKSIWIWARKNGNDIPNSATRITITGNAEYKVAAWNFIISMNANDWFELAWAVSDVALSIAAPAAETFCPAIPSVILTVTEAAL